MPKGKNLECRFITQVNNLDGQPVETKFYWGRQPTSLVLKHIKTFSSVGPWMWKKLIFLNIILQILDRLSSSSRKLSAFFQLKLCQQALDTIPAHRNHPGSVCPAPPRPNLCVCVYILNQQLHEGTYETINSCTLAGCDTDGASPAAGYTERLFIIITWAQAKPNCGMTKPGGRASIKHRKNKWQENNWLGT